MKEDIVTGGLYAFREPDGRYRVIKVLVIDRHAVHLRKYATRFDQLPSSIRSSDLSLDGSGSAEGFGIGHFPLARAAFDQDGKVLIGHERVSDEELDGYRLWAGIDSPMSE